MTINGQTSSFRFRREEHLKGRKEIRQVFSKGKRYGCYGAKLYALENELPYNRICFTFAKPVKQPKVKQSKLRESGLQHSKETRKDKKVSWNAVVRNRARRLGREAFRLMKSRLVKGYDFILLIFPDAETAGSGKTLSDRTVQLESLFTRAGLIK